jgi:hypothetical protein
MRPVRYLWHNKRAEEEKRQAQREAEAKKKAEEAQVVSNFAFWTVLIALILLCYWPRTWKVCSLIPQGPPCGILAQAAVARSAPRRLPPDLVPQSPIEVPQRPTAKPSPYFGPGFYDAASWTSAATCLSPLHASRCSGSPSCPL